MRCHSSASDTSQERLRMDLSHEGARVQVIPVEVTKRISAVWTLLWRKCHQVRLMDFRLFSCVWVLIFHSRASVSFSPRQVLSLECECFLNGYKARVLFANVSFSPFSYFFPPYADHPSRFLLSLTFWRCGAFGLVQLVRLTLSRIRAGSLSV